MRYRESEKEIKPSIPCILLYDEIGSQTINGSFLTWDNIEMISSHFYYLLDSDRIILYANSSGLYEITFDISVNGTGIAYFDIYKNGLIVDGTRTYVSSSAQSVNADSCSISFIVYLTKDDYIQIKGTLSSGAIGTYAHSSRLLIKFIPFKGWNNSAGGRPEFSGGVDR
jgi:hypothetical protein